MDLVFTLTISDVTQDTEEDGLNFFISGIIEKVEDEVWEIADAHEVDIEDVKLILKV